MPGRDDTQATDDASGPGFQSLCLTSPLGIASNPRPLHQGKEESRNDNFASCLQHGQGIGQRLTKLGAQSRGAPLLRARWISFSRYLSRGDISINFEFVGLGLQSQQRRENHTGGLKSKAQIISLLCRQVTATTVPLSEKPSQKDVTWPWWRWWWCWCWCCWWWWWWRPESSSSSSLGHLLYVNVTKFNWFSLIVNRNNW